MADTRHVENLIRNMGELPTIPSVFLTVNKMLSDPRTSAVDVGKAISEDQVIASKALKLANSAFYGLTSRVNTISHAVAVLGFSATKNIVLTTSVLSALNFKKNIDGFSLAAFWKHSAAVGAITRLIATEVLPAKREEAFVIGLLHDIGKLILAICTPEDFAKCLNFAINKDCLFLDAEKEVLGICHTEVVALINERWNMPAEIATVIISHHKNISECGEHSELVAIVKLADVLARGLRFGHACDNSIPIIEGNIFDFLKITPKKLDAILTASTEALQNSMSFLNTD
jgi:putative nucleotidyltransferase with HDIG domain